MPEDSILDSLELSARATNVLRAYGRSDTLKDFLALKRATVLGLTGAGVGTWREIERRQAMLLGLPYAAPDAPVEVRVDAMTLRDAAALAVLQSFCAQTDTSGTWSWLPDMAAAEAWRVADAFIAAREGKTDDQ